MTYSKAIIPVLIIALSSLAASASITATDPANTTIMPGKEKQYTYDITFDSNDTQVKITAQDTGDYTVTYNSFRKFNSDDTVKPVVQATDDGNNTQNITFVFDVQKDNASDTTIKRYAQLQTEIPYDALITETWINQSNYLTVNNKDYYVSNIANNLYFNNNSVKVEDIKTLNNARITLLDTIPSEYAKITVESKQDDATATVQTRNINKEKECEIGLEPIQGLVNIKRGELFSFETRNINTQEPISGVIVTFKNKKGERIGQITTDASGGGSILIPQDVGLKPDELEDGGKQRIDIKATKTDSECNTYRKSWTTSTSWGDYITSQDQFQLELSVDNTTFYNTITGTVTTKTGNEDISGLITITTPDDSETDVAFNQSGFTYKPEASGEYTLQAEKSGYVSSETVTVEYVADKDGDGIANENDECPAIEGVQANNGCPQKEADLRILSTETGQSPEYIEPQTTYRLELVDTNGSIINYGGKFNVTNTDTSVDFESGTATVKFGEEDTYGININDEQFSDKTATFQVQSQPFISGLSWSSALYVLLIGGAAYAIYWLLSGNKTRTKQNERVEYEF